MAHTATVTGFRYSDDGLETELRRAFEALRWTDSIKKDSKVFVKPNFTLPFSKPGVTTHESVLEATLALVKDRASEVFVGESDGGYGSFTAELSLRNHGLPGTCNRTGATMLNLSELPRTRVRGIVTGRETEALLPKALVDMDQTISVPVLKVHVVTTVSLSLKNLWGCHPDTMRILDHTNLPRRLALIARAVHLKHVVVDGIVGLNKRGPISGEPVGVGAIIVGDNPVATDATAARLMGFPAERIKHIVVASEAGIGPYREEDIALIADLRPFQQRFVVRPTLVDRLGALTFRSKALTKLVFDSGLTMPIYRMLRRDPRKRIGSPGDEL